MLYTYLMAWFVTHYKGRMYNGADADKESLPTIFFKFFPNIDVAEFGGLICEVGFLCGGYFGGCRISTPSHLVYQSGNMCELSCYFPSRFARQFGYDQLYVDNPC